MKDLDDIISYIKVEIIRCRRVPDYEKKAKSEFMAMMIRQELERLCGYVWIEDMEACKYMAEHDLLENWRYTLDVIIPTLNK